MKPIKKDLLKNYPHIKEFTKNADFYAQNNLIQKRVAAHLLKKIDKRYRKILDLGCGRGEIYENLPSHPDLFVGVDLSEKMCNLHPKSKQTIILNEDFEKESLYERLEAFAPFDLIISSSSLQWAKNLDFVLKNLQKLKGRWLFGIFLEGTFKTIRELTGQNSSLPSKEEIVKTVSKYRKCEFETVNYRLFFKDNISKFRYIKRSGVSGGERKLSYKKTKDLIKNYPLSYLEFEVIYISCKEESS